MVENVKNLGQLLIPAKQAANGTSSDNGTKRFTIDYEENHSEINTDKNEMSDSKSDHTNYINENNPVNKEEYSVDKKSSDESDNKIETTGNKKEVKKQGNSESSSDNELSEQDDIVNVPETAAIAKCESDIPEQIIIDEIPEETQDEIEIILPENPGTENELKSPQSILEGQKTDTVLPEMSAAQEGSQYVSNEQNVQQVSQANDIQADQSKGNAAVDISQKQNNVFPENVSQDKIENPANIVDSEIIEQSSQVSKSETQNVTDIENSQPDDSELNVSQDVQENVLDGSTNNSNDSLKNKPDLAEVLPLDSQDDIDSNTHTFEEKIAIEQAFANTQADVTQKVSSGMLDKANIEISKDNTGNDIPDQISKHITETIQGSTIPQSGEKQITIRLNPPELGSVMVKFTERNSELVGTLEVSKAETKAEIEHALPDILRSLSESGIQMKRIDVVSTENKFSNSDLPKDQFMQDGNSSQSDQNNSQNQNSGANQFNNSGFQQWLSGTIDYARGYSMQNQSANSSINMLA